MPPERIRSRPPLIWWWVALPSVSFVLAVRNDWVRLAPLAAAELLGRPWPPSAAFLQLHGATIVRLGEIEPDGTRDRSNQTPKTNRTSG